MKRFFFFNSFTLNIPLAPLFQSILACGFVGVCGCCCCWAAAILAFKCAGGAFGWVGDANHLLVSITPIDGSKLFLD